MICPQEHHLLTNHKVDINHGELNSQSDFVTSTENGIYVYKKMKEKYFDGGDFRGFQCFLDYDSKSFFVQTRNFRGFIFIWLQLFGSQFEAKNYEYSVKIHDPKIGKFSYSGPVRSLDDDKNAIYDSGLDLSVPHSIIRKLLQNWKIHHHNSLQDYFGIEIRIRFVIKSVPPEEAEVHEYSSCNVT